MKLLVLAVMMILLAGAAQAAGPQPPCQQAPTPAYPPESADPIGSIWTADDLRRQGWTPPSCLGWTGESRLVVALAGTFRSSRSLPELLQRLTAVSAYPSVKYWSVSRQQWRPVALEAATLADATGASIRADMQVSELMPGRELFYVESGDLTGRTSYRVRIAELAPDRAVVLSQNVTSIRVLMIPTFDPGSLQLATFLERAGPGLWHLYQITRVGPGGSGLAADHASSYLNRLVAFERYLAGVPTDREPPLAPR